MWQSSNTIRAGHMPHIALCCLEGSTPQDRKVYYVIVLYKDILVSLEAKHKPDKPLGEDGGRCPDVMLPLWSYKSELLTPKPESYHHLLYRRSPSSPRR